MLRRSLLLLVALAVTSSCSDDDDDVTTTTAPSGTSEAPTTTAAPTTTTVRPNLDAVAVTLTEVASGLESPVDLAFRAGDDRLYVVEQGGRVRIVDNGQVVGDPVFEVDVSTGNEQGLLGLTFSPDGTKLYVDYTDPDGDTHVDEHTMAGDVADLATKRELLFVEQPFPNHNGGRVIFGPDGMLYIGLGDGGAAGDPFDNGQDLAELLGKILRVDPNATVDAPYGIPGDNPFVGHAAARPEVWMFGLRNPWRFSFDLASGDVWIADVGQNEWEEIDFTAAVDAPGSNWGWNAFEGNHLYDGSELPDMRGPIFELAHVDGNCSVTGGFVYRGEAIPALRGAYVFADYCVGDVIGLVQQGGALADSRELGVHADEVTSFAQDPAGEIYVLSRPGSISRIDPA